MELEKVVNELLESVPPYTEFMTVDELVESSRRLVSRHSDVAELVEAGPSRTDTPVYALVIQGGDEKRVLAFAFPHPNEPIGSLTLEYLSWRLAENRDLLKKLGATWIIVKVADVYGARLNEGWFKGPFDVKKYVLNYYRPPPHKQVEWSFPIEYKELRFTTPIPETRALMKLIDEWRPTHIYSLHNAGFTGTYYYITRRPPEDVLDVLTKIPKRYGVPIHRGEPEAPYMEKIAEGVFKMPSTKMIYDWMEKYLGRPPVDAIKHGGSSYDYALRVNPEVLELVCEVPYIYDDRLDVELEVGIPRREFLRIVLSKERNFLENFRKLMERIEKFVRPGNPFYEALSSFIEIEEKRLEAEEKWVETSKELDESATVAQIFDAYLRTYWRPLFRYGLLYRSANYEISKGATEPALQEIREEALKNIDRYLETFNKLCRYRVIPVQSLVRIQVASIVATLLKG